MSRPTTQALMWKEWEKLTLAATEMGHEISTPEADTGVSLVGECVSCGGLFAVDGQEAPYQFSRGLKVPCDGRQILVA